MVVKPCLINNITLLTIGVWRKIISLFSGNTLLWTSQSVYIHTVFIYLTGSDVVAPPITTDFWPPAMSSAIPRIIGLLDDSSLTLTQTSGE